MKCDTCEDTGLAYTNKVPCPDCDARVARVNLGDEELDALYREGKELAREIAKRVAGMNGPWTTEDRLDAERAAHEATRAELAACVEMSKYVADLRGERAKVARLRVVLSDAWAVVRLALVPLGLDTHANLAKAESVVAAALADTAPEEPT